MAVANHLYQREKTSTRRKSEIEKERCKKGDPDMKGKKLMAAMAILAVVLMASTTWAYGPGGGRGWGRGPCYSGDVAGPAGLNLTAEQSQKMQGLRVAHQKEVQPLQAVLFEKRGELRILWLEASPSEEKILKVNREIQAIKAQLQEKATKHRLQMLNLLTPEQKAQVQSFGPGKGRGMGPGKGPGMGSGMGPGGW